VDGCICLKIPRSWQILIQPNLSILEEHLEYPFAYLQPLYR
jgi:hypothetical protein